ncbi:hypothetical protein SCANM63S_06771 [Streptomyces canarius]
MDTMAIGSSEATAVGAASAVRVPTDSVRRCAVRTAGVG